MSSSDVDEDDREATAGEEGDFGEWEEEEEEPRVTRCLFSDAVFPSPTAALTHAARAFGFDLRELYHAHGLDFYGAMQAINYARAVAIQFNGIRSDAAGEGASDPAAAAKAAAAGIASGKHRDEKYLIPVEADDPLLFDWEGFVGVEDDVDAMDDDEEVERREKEAQMAASQAQAHVQGVVSQGRGHAADGDVAASGSHAPSPVVIAQALASARAENDALRLQVLEMAHALGIAPGPGGGDDDAPANVGAGLVSGAAGGVQTAASSAAPTRSAGPAKAGAAVDRKAPKTAAQVVDDDYFGSYSFFDIHRTMLDDVSRTATYRAALEENPSLISGKRVVDIGCGTGILSMFAARGGAAAVIGVDGAADIAAVARANVAHAKLDDRVDVVQGKLERLLEDPEAIPGAGSFDVLVSEWMGYALLYESMLDTVLAARDKLLKPGGAVLPDIATIHVAGFGRNATSLPFWDDVYGFEMPTVQEKLMSDAVKQAVVCPVKGEHVVTTSALVQSLDCATMTVADTEFSSAEYMLTARTDGRRGDERDDEVKAGAGEGATGLTQTVRAASEVAGTGPVMCHGVVLWFDTAFSARFCKEKAVVLSTSPYERQTHWAQTMLHFPEPIALRPAGEVEAGDAGAAPGSRENPAAAIKVRVGMAKCAEEIRARALDISLEFTPVASDGREGQHGARIYKM